MVTNKIFFIRKKDQIVLRRYTTTQHNKFFVKKEIETQLAKVLNNNLDLDRKDILIREYEGINDSYGR